MSSSQTSLHLNIWLNSQLFKFQRFLSQSISACQTGEGRLLLFFDGNLVTDAFWVKHFPAFLSPALSRSGLYQMLADRRASPGVHSTVLVMTRLARRGESWWWCQLWNLLIKRGTMLPRWDLTWCPSYTRITLHRTVSTNTTLRTEFQAQDP